MRLAGLDQPLRGLKVLASLGTGAIMLFIVYSFATYLDLAAGDAPGGYGGAVANDWLNIGLDVVLPGTYLMLAFFALVAGAVVSGRFR